MNTITIVAYVKPTADGWQAVINWEGEEGCRSGETPSRAVAKALLVIAGKHLSRDLRHFKPHPRPPTVEPAAT